MFGDLPELLAQGTNAAGNAIGGMFGMQPNRLPERWQTLNRSVPNSHEIQSGIENYTGKFYEPKSTAGEYARTMGEFGVAIPGGPGSLMTRAVTLRAIPGAMSEGAGQLTQGSTLSRQPASVVRCWALWLRAHLLVPSRQTLSTANALPR